MSTTSVDAAPTPRPAEGGNRFTRPWRDPSISFQRALALVLLICQGGITVTGAIVRVTGSGLGCDTWPLCHEGSLVPVQGVTPWVHQLIEFGNRLLAFVVAAAAAAVLVAVIRARRSPGVKALAWISLLGVVLQAVIGGISVRLDLQWWSVAIHFLPSMVLVWVAGVLYMRVAETDGAEPTERYAAPIRALVVAAAVALCFVLVTGTMVTGSGPHSGDSGVGMDGRLNMDTETLAYVHAACMYVYLICTLVAVYQLRRTNAPKDAYKTGLVLIALIVIQWAIGVTQFRLGVPRWTIPAHIAMSSAVVAFSAILYAHGKRRLPTLR